MCKTVQWERKATLLPCSDWLRCWKKKIGVNLFTHTKSINFVRKSLLSQSLNSGTTQIVLGFVLEITAL